MAVAVVALQLQQEALAATVVIRAVAAVEAALETQLTPAQAVTVAMATSVS